MEARCVYKLTLGSWPMIKHDKESGLTKFYEIQAHFHKREKINPNNLSWHAPKGLQQSIKVNFPI